MGGGMMYGMPPPMGAPHAHPHAQQTNGQHMLVPPLAAHMMTHEHMLPPQCVPMAPRSLPEMQPQHSVPYMPHHMPHQLEPQEDDMLMDDVDNIENNIDWLLEGLDNLDDFPMVPHGMCFFVCVGGVSWFL